MQDRNRLREGQFLGDCRLSRRWSSFRVTDTEYPRSTEVALHSHASGYVSVVYAGGFRETIGATARERGPGSLAWHPASECHRQTSGPEGARALNVEMTTGTFQRLESRVRLAGEARLDPASADLLVDRIRTLCSRADEFTALELEALLLLALGSRSRRIPPWIGEAFDLLRSTFPAVPGTTNVARALELHPAHVAHVWRHSLGTTIGGWVRAMRLARARRLLASASPSLAEIAQIAGFSDQAHMCRILKASDGITPSEFRRRALRIGGSPD